MWSFPKTPRRRTRRPKLTQLDLWQVGGPDSGQPDMIPTSALLRHRSCARVLDLIRQVRIFFPELDGITLKIGLTRRAAGLAAHDQPWIWVNPRKLTRHTIAHEMVHLLQFRGHAPQGEKSADLYALARHVCLADDLPYYLKTPRTLRAAALLDAPSVHLLLHRVARESLVRRDQGERNYLRWFEQELDRLWSAELARLAQRALNGAPALPAQTSLF